MSTEEFNAHMQKHQLTVANVSDNFYLPEISAEPVYKNNVATSDVNCFFFFNHFKADDFYRFLNLNVFFNFFLSLILSSVELSIVIKILYQKILIQTME